MLCWVEGEGGRGALEVSQLIFVIGKCGLDGKMVVVTVTMTCVSCVMVITS